MKPRRPLLMLLIAVVTLTSCGLEQDLADRKGLDRSSVIVAPPLSAPTLDGAHFDLSQQHGHVVIIDFWASWCGPCHKQQPELDRIHDLYAPRGLVMVGVDLRDNEAAARAYQQEFHVPYPSIFDADGAITSAFDIAAPPTTLIVDGTGHIVLRQLGGITAAGLSPTLDRLMPRK